jgi:hypothetical protein
MSMIVLARPKLSRIAFPIVSIVLFFLFEWIAFSHTRFSPVASDTNPARGALSRAIGTLYFVGAQPMRAIARDAILTGDEGRWTTKIVRLVGRFRTHEANVLAFAVVNTALWCLSALVVFLVAKVIRSRLERSVQ